MEFDGLVEAYQSENEELLSELMENCLGVDIGIEKNGHVTYKKGSWLLDKDIKKVLYADGTTFVLEIKNNKIITVYIM